VTALQYAIHMWLQNGPHAACTAPLKLPVRTMSAREPQWLTYKQHASETLSHMLSQHLRAPNPLPPPISTAAVIALAWVQFPQLNTLRDATELELGPSQQLSPAHGCQACFHALVAQLHGPTGRLLLRWLPMLLGLDGHATAAYGGAACPLLPRGEQHWGLSSS
jgi:hypothetical protein